MGPLGMCMVIGGKCLKGQAPPEKRSYQCKRNLHLTSNRSAHIKTTAGSLTPEEPGCGVSDLTEKA